MKGQQSLSVISVSYILLGIQSCYFVIVLPTLMAKVAGNAAWIFMLCAGIWMLLIYTGISKLAGLTGMSWAEMNRIAFGHILGFGIGIAWMVSMIGTNAYIMQKYIRLLNMYEFPNAQPLFYTILITLAGLFAVWGGLHTLSGLFFVSYTVQIILIIIVFVSIFPYIEWKYIAPFNSIEIHNYLHTLIYSFTGFAGLEMCVLLFSSTSNFNKSGMIRLFAPVIVINLVLQILLVEACMSVYGLDSLKITAFPTITMMRLVRLPFIEQLDQFGIGLLFIRFLPIIALYLWSSTELSRKLIFRSLSYRFHLFLQTSLLLVVGLCFIPIQITQKLDMLVMSISAGWFVIYAPLLMLFAWLRVTSRRSRRKGV